MVHRDPRCFIFMNCWPCQNYLEEFFVFIWSKHMGRHDPQELEWEGNSKKYPSLIRFITLRVHTWLEKKIIISSSLNCAMQSPPWVRSCSYMRAKLLALPPPYLPPLWLFSGCNSYHSFLTFTITASLSSAAPFARSCNLHGCTSSAIIFISCLLSGGCQTESWTKITPISLPKSLLHC